MKLVINRDRRTDVDRGGNVRAVSFQLRFELELSDEEAATVQTNGLGRHYIFESTAKLVTVDEATRGVEWSVPSLEVALSIQNSMIENCKRFAALVSAGRAFEGSETLELT